MVKKRRRENTVKLVTNEKKEKDPRNTTSFMYTKHSLHQHAITSLNPAWSLLKNQNHQHRSIKSLSIIYCWHKKV